MKKAGVLLDEFSWLPSANVRQLISGETEINDANFKTKKIESTEKRLLVAMMIAFDDVLNWLL